MADAHDLSSLPKTEFSFKPPHLDKVVCFFRLTGIAHSSCPLRSAKQIALLLYNLLTLCLHVANFIATAINYQGHTARYKLLFVYLTALCNLASALFSIYLIIHLVVLSRKSHLSSLPKPNYWPSLPKHYEEEMPKANRIVFLCWFLLIVIPSIGVTLFHVLPPHCPGNCNQTSLNETTDGTLTYNMNPKGYLLTMFYISVIPSNLGISVVLLYLVMWINYCTRLFEGINQTLDKMEMPFDFKAIKTCKEQYNIVSRLVEKINDKYGVLVAYFLFNASVLLFIYGYLFLMTFLSGGSVDLANSTILLLIFLGSVILFLQSFSFENAVSRRVFFNVCICIDDLDCQVHNNIEIQIIHISFCEPQYYKSLP